MQATCEGYFRAHVSAAPLKRSRPWLGSRGVHTFPRSRERGPIEASALCPTEYPPFMHFRAHVSAAPLKRLRVGRRRRDGPHFRAHVSAAPLKLKSALLAELGLVISALT